MSTIDTQAGGEGFQQLLAELTATFVAVEGSRVDEHIADALALVGAHFKADRCFLGQLSLDSETAQATHLWRADNLPPGTGDPTEPLNELYPWLMQRMMSGRPVLVATLDDLPAEASAERAFGENAGIQSTAMLPVKLGSEVIAIFGLDMIRSSRRWKAEEVERLELIAGVLASALQRQRDWQRLDLGHRFERMLAEVTAALAGTDGAEETDPIEQALRTVGEHLGADRCTLLQAHQGDWRVHRMWSMTGTGIDNDLRDVHVQDAFPWLHSRLSRGENVVLDDTSNLPKLARSEREYCARAGIRSLLMAPVVADERVLGALALDALERRRHWTKDTVERFQLLGEVFFAVIERWRARQRLDRVLEFERLLAEISTSFVEAAAEETDDCIDRALATLGRRIGAERTSIWEFAADAQTRVSHIWFEEGYSIDDTGGLSPLDQTFPWLASKILGNREVIIHDLEEFPARAKAERAYCEAAGIRSFVHIPLSVNDAVVGSLGISSLTAELPWPEHLLERLHMVAHLFANALARQRSEHQLVSAFDQIAQLKDHLQAENLYLQEEVRRAYDPAEIVGDSAPMQQVLRSIELVAAMPSTVLISGETGTGKELVARAIHGGSRRSKHPLVKVDCAALPPTLVESELFGHEKGAFTGATSRRQGRFELADGGTIFLDEIGELEPEIQAKLLRVLQEGKFERLGGNRTISVDVRVIAATNRDLEASRREGRFRDDLFFRLSVFPIVVPPLRERRDDIPLLAWHFTEVETRRLGRAIETIPDRVMNALVQHDWPGNVRELQNVIERAIIVAPGPELELASSPGSEEPLGEQKHTRSDQAPRTDGPDIAAQAPEPGTLADIERAHVKEALVGANWKISGPGGAAEKLGLNEGTLRYRMKKHGLQRPW